LTIPSFKSTPETVKKREEDKEEIIVIKKNHQRIPSEKPSSPPSFIMQKSEAFQKIDHQ